MRMKATVELEFEGTADATERDLEAAVQRSVEQLIEALPHDGRGGTQVRKDTIKFKLSTEVVPTMRGR